MADSRPVQVLTTIDSAAAAADLARAVVEARLAACVQIVGPVQSVFWWNGGVQTEEEWQLVAKTTAAAYPRLEALLREVHSYDEPEIIATEIVAGSAGYLAWIEEETAPQDTWGTSPTRT